MGGVLVLDVVITSNQMRKGFQHLRESRGQDEDVVGDQVSICIWITVLVKAFLPLKHLCFDSPLKFFSESEGGASCTLCRVDDDV